MKQRHLKKLLALALILALVLQCVPALAAKVRDYIEATINENVVRSYEGDPKENDNNLSPEAQQSLKAVFEVTKIKIKSVTYDAVIMTLNTVENETVTPTLRYTFIKDAKGWKLYKIEKKANSHFTVSHL